MSQSSLPSVIHTLSKYCNDYLFSSAYWALIVGLLTDTVLYFFFIFIHDTKVGIIAQIPNTLGHFLFYALKTIPMLFMGTLLWIIVLGRKYQFNLQQAQEDPQLFLYIMHKTGFQFMVPPFGYTLALFFSAIGDAFLAHNTLNAEIYPKLAHNSLLFGIAAFLVAQLFYAVSFSLTFRQNRRNLVVHNWRWELALPFVVFAVFLFSVICMFADKPLPSEIKVAVGAYALVIACMGWRSAVAYKEASRLHKQTALKRLTGAVIFMASDSLIALRTFLGSYTMNLMTLGGAISLTENSFGKIMSLLVMITYWVAQILIVTSIEEPVIEHNGVMRQQLKA